MDEENHLNENTKPIFIDSIQNTQLEPETLFLKEINPLEICMKIDVDEKSDFKKSTERKRPLKRYKNSEKNVTKNKKKNILKKDEDTTDKTNPVDIKNDENSLKIDVKIDVEEKGRFKKITKRKRTSKESKKKKENIETNNPKEESFKKDEEIIKKNKEEDNKNRNVVDTEVANYSKETKLDENFNDQNDSSESDNDPLSNYINSSISVEQLQEEQDKLIAEHFPITCHICDIPLASYAIMARHHKEKHNQRGYAVCCNQRLNSRLEIVNHIRVHQNPEYFKCKQCDKKFNRSSNLKHHIKYSHERKKEYFECDICGKCLSSESILRSHKLLHAADNKDKIPCKECDKYYLTKHSLTKHIRLVHLKKYIICELCGKSISNNHRYNVHMLQHEGKAKAKVSCELCGRILSDLACLKRHMVSNHPPNGVKPELKCSMCPKKFASTAYVRIHERRVHENKYAKKCTLCDKTFKNAGALKDHMSFHTGQPLHACGFCPSIFHSSGNMHAHRKREHPKEWLESLKKKYYASNFTEKNVTETIK